MSKVAKVVGTVAGVVAAVAMIGSGVGAALGGTMMLAGVGSASSIAAIAGAVSGVANMAAGVSAKKPPAQGSASQVVIGSNQPQPYSIGRSYVGGHLIHDVGYGGTVSKVKNPYRSMFFIGSGAGPIDSIEGYYADFSPVSFSGSAATGYYAGFLYKDDQLGARPEGSALTGPWGAIPNWGSSHKLSAYAAWALHAKFDKDGKVFASGLPQFGVVGKWVLAYDPRLDSTYPGGSGAHRFDDESTWEWTENPALHAVAYGRGRFEGSKKLIGCGFDKPGIDLAAFVELANICDANGWVVGGTIHEGAGISKWDNLKRILAAASAEPVFVGAQLSVRFNAPRIALDTITAEDLADGEYSVPAMKTWRDRLNGIIPRYRSETHKWEYVQSDLVSVPTYVTEDGEEKQEERQYDLVQDKDQAAQLAAYELVNGREFGPITLPCKPRMLEYRPGEALSVDVPELGLNDQLCIIVGRMFDPATGIVTLTLESETTAKHAFALGQTGTAPPTPSITTGEDLDDVIGDNSVPEALTTTLISTSFVTDADPADGLLQGTDTQITVESHARAYSDKTVGVVGAVLTGLTASTQYHIYYDDPDRAGGAVTYATTTVPEDAATSAIYPSRHYVGSLVTDTMGGTGTSGGGSSPPGWRGEDYHTP